MDHETLWNQLQQFSLIDPSASLSFVDRLARDNAWTMEFSLRAIEEYKKFIFLIAVSGEPLTPSDEVDQVWHLHLLYTESYWDEMCGKILKTRIHHGPTKGGAKEGAKFTDWYTRTKQQYVTFFKTEPPLDLWPPHEKRFGNNLFQRININEYWIIKKPNFIS